MNKRFEFKVEELNSLLTDWELCFICQKITREKLICPAGYLGTNKGVGYITLISYFEEFKKKNSLPTTINFNRLDDGSGGNSTLLKNNATYHKTCSLKFNQKELLRAQKRFETIIETGPAVNDESTSSVKIITRSTAAALASNIPICFLRNEQASHSHAFHDVTTFEVNARIKGCAQNLQDLDLLSKLSAGDLIASEAKYHRDCLSNLYKTDNRARAKNIERIHARSFAELLNFIQSSLEEDVSPVFRLRQLNILYETE